MRCCGERAEQTTASTQQTEKAALVHSSEFVAKAAIGDKRQMGSVRGDSI